MEDEENRRVSSSNKFEPAGNKTTLKALTMDQIRQIDRALSEIGPFAELRLVKEDGKIKCMQKLQSESLFPLYRKKSGIDE